MRCKNFNVVGHFIVFALLALFLAPLNVSAQNDPVVKVPDTLEEARESGVRIADKIIGVIPGIITRMWQEQVIPVWRSMGEWAKAELWEKRVSGAFQTALDRVQELLGKEVEKRTEIVQEELQEQTEQAKQGLWERFRALFRKE